jgi:hypothetical protein
VKSDSVYLKHIRDSIRRIEEDTREGRERDPQEFLAEVDALHKRMPQVHLTEKLLRAAKNEGRS